MVARLLQAGSCGIMSLMEGRTSLPVPSEVCSLSQITVSSHA